MINACIQTSLCHCRVTTQKQQNAAATATSIYLHLCTLAKESFVQFGVVVKFAHLQEQKS
jgi:hypothetical protein